MERVTEALVASGSSRTRMRSSPEEWGTSSDGNEIGRDEDEDEDEEENGGTLETEKAEETSGLEDEERELEENDSTRVGVNGSWDERGRARESEEREEARAEGDDEAAGDVAWEGESGVVDEEISDRVVDEAEGEGEEDRAAEDKEGEEKRGREVASGGAVNGDMCRSMSSSIALWEAKSPTMMRAMCSGRYHRS